MKKYPFINSQSKCLLKHFQSNLHCLIHEHYTVTTLLFPSWHIEWETRSFMNLPSFDILWKAEWNLIQSIEFNASL